MSYADTCFDSSSHYLPHAPSGAWHALISWNGGSVPGSSPANIWQTKGHQLIRCFECCVYLRAKTRIQPAPSPQFRLRRPLPPPGFSSEQNFPPPGPVRSPFHESQRGILWGLNTGSTTGIMVGLFGQGNPRQPRTHMTLAIPRAENAVPPEDHHGLVRDTRNTTRSRIWFVLINGFPRMWAPALPTSQPATSTIRGFPCLCGESPSCHPILSMSDPISEGGWCCAPGGVPNCLRSHREGTRQTPMT